MTARRLEGRTAIITGGAGGIGAATGRLFCEHGASVALVDMEGSPLSEVAATANGPPPADHFNPKKNDNSQGANNATPGAILKVCSKDTPAAHRAAICRTGVSPDARRPVVG